MKMRDVILGKKEQIALAARKHGVLSVDLFGSCARGEENGKSDIDLAVLVIPNGNIVERDKAFASEVQMLFDRKVNVTNRRGIGIDKNLWEKVRKDAITIVAPGEGASPC